MIGLVVFPLCFVIFAAVALDVKIQSHWGLQTTQFLAILLAVWFYQKWGPYSLRYLQVWAVVQTFALILYLGQITGVFAYEGHGAAVRKWPAQEISNTALSFWASKTNCPLHYLTGHPAVSAMIAAYSDQNILVLEDGDYKKSPWINPQMMAQAGYLDVDIAKQASSQTNTFSFKFAVNGYSNLEYSFNDYLVLKAYLPYHQCIKGS